MKLTPRKANLALLTLAFAAIPPLAGRAIPGLFSDPRAAMLSVAASFVAGALALNMVMGYAGQISLGHGALLGVGAFTSGILTTRMSLPLPLGFVAAAITSSAVALVIGLPALRLKGLYLAIATIGFTFMMENSFFRWGPLTRGGSGLEMTRILFGDTSLRRETDYLALSLVVLIILWVIDQNVMKTKVGRAFHGIREDEDVARSFGIDVTRYKLTAFVISGAFAGVAGAMFGHLVRFVTDSTYSYNKWSLLLVMLVVVGGLGSRWGVAVAGVFFAISPRILSAIQGWDLVVGAFLLVYTVARHPGGLAEAVRESRDAKLKKAMEGKALPAAPAPSLPRPVPRTGSSLADPILKVDDIVVRFGGLVAVNGASIQVSRGKIVGLIGPNGAGKSTLFNVISGFIEPERGSVSLGGQDVTSSAPHVRAQLGMGRTFQQIGLAKNLSVLENLLLAQHPLADYGTFSSLAFTSKVAATEEELIERATDAIERLGFSRYIDTPVKNLSHGQQRIAELGCALMTAPDLLLLDEPSAGFSPAAVENLTDRLREIRDELGKTVLLIEHNIPMVLDLCDYIYVLNFGEVLAQGSHDEIAAHPDVIAAYLGEDVAQLEQA